MRNAPPSVAWLPQSAATPCTPCAPLSVSAVAVRSFVGAVLSLSLLDSGLVVCRGLGLPPAFVAGCLSGLARGLSPAFVAGCVSGLALGVSLLHGANYTKCAI